MNPMPRGICDYAIIPLISNEWSPMNPMPRGICDPLLTLATLATLALVPHEPNAERHL